MEGFLNSLFIKPIQDLSGIPDQKVKKTSHAEFNNPTPNY